MGYIETFFEKIGKNKAYRAVTAILFPVILTVFAFCKVNKGLDITDASFNPYNYGHIGSLTDTWFYSFLYTNLTGAFFYILPFGKTMLGMNVYTGLVKLALALGAYFVLSGPVKIRREYAFLGSFIALGLSWCPTTVLYNYLTYLLFFAGTVLLYLGLVKEKKGLLFAAGIVLGSNVFVRFPNLCEAGLIVGLWYYALLKKEKPALWLKKTLICILGYAVALLVGLLVCAVTPGGISGFFDGITGLFGMTKEATEYAPFSMVRGILEAYRNFWFFTERTIIIMLACALIGLVFPHKLDWVRYVLSTLAVGFLLVILFRNNMFSFSYSDYSSIYGPGVLLTEISLLFAIVFLFLKAEKEDKLLAMLLVITVLITPLGTNNELYANINYGFFTIPVLLYLLTRDKGIQPYFKPINYALFLITLFVCVQGTLFGARFAFRDGQPEAMDTKVEGIPALKGMYTTKAHAEELKGLIECVDKEEYSGGVILYGDVSGLGFYLGEDVAIDFAWPTLDSYPSEHFEQEMERLDNECALPLVIMQPAAYENFAGGQALTSKQRTINNFLVNNNYKMRYLSDRVAVLSADRNGE